MDRPLSTPLFAQLLPALRALPLPRRRLAGMQCRESERDGRYASLVAVALPWIGPFICYEGWLEPA